MWNGEKIVHALSISKPCPNFREGHVCNLAGLSECVAFIVIDKHGNESKPIVNRNWWID